MEHILVSLRGSGGHTSAEASNGGGATLLAAALLFCSPLEPALEVAAFFVTGNLPIDVCCECWRVQASAGNEKSEWDGDLLSRRRMPRMLQKSNARKQNDQHTHISQLQVAKLSSQATCPI
jgi:hypothetical protein